MLFTFVIVTTVFPVSLIEHFDFIFIYRPRKWQIIPDAVSRMSKLQSEENSANMERLLKIDNDLREGKNNVVDLE